MRLFLLLLLVSQLLLGCSWVTASPHNSSHILSPDKEHSIAILARLQSGFFASDEEYEYSIGSFNGSLYSNKPFMVTEYSPLADIHWVDNEHIALKHNDGSPDGPPDLYCNIKTLKSLKDCSTTPPAPALENNGINAKLITAASHGNLKEAQTLLKQGANPDYKTSFDYTPLITAAEGGNLELVKLFLNQGANLNATTKLKETALALAVFNNHPETAQFLLDKGITKQGIDFNESLTWACVRGETQTAKILLEHGANIEGTSTLGSRPPLMVAALWGQPETVAFLLTKGADPNAQRNDDTALIAAIDGAVRNVGKASDKDRLKIMEILLEHGADINNYQDVYETPLMKAITFEKEDIVQLLLHHGADVNLSNRYGETALMKAVGERNPKLVKLLLHAGADVNAITAFPKSNYTALDIAFGQTVRWKETTPEIVVILKKHGAKTASELKTATTELNKG